MDPCGNLTELKPISNERPKSTPASTIPIIFCTTCNKQNHGWAEFGVHIFEDHNSGNFLLAQHAFGTDSSSPHWRTTISRQSDPDQEYQMQMPEQWLDNSSAADHRWDAMHANYSGNAHIMNASIGPGIDANPISYQAVPNPGSSRTQPNSSGMVLYSSEHQNPMEMASAGIPRNDSLEPQLNAADSQPVRSVKEKNRADKMAKDEVYREKRLKTGRDSKKRKRQEERALKAAAANQSSAATATNCATKAKSGRKAKI